MSNKKYIDIIDVNTLRNEEDVLEAESYLKQYKAKCTFLEAVSIFWTFDFTMMGLQAQDLGGKLVSFALSAFSAYLGGRCHIRRQDATHELAGLKEEKKNVMIKKYGFDR